MVRFSSATADNPIRWNSNLWPITKIIGELLLYFAIMRPRHFESDQFEHDRPPLSDIWKTFDPTISNIRVWAAFKVRQMIISNYYVEF